jgi:hypothetical protein
MARAVATASSHAAATATSHAPAPAEPSPVADPATDDAATAESLTEIDRAVLTRMLAAVKEL